MSIIHNSRPHVVVIPLPAQGHINPLMHLSQIIAKHGIKVSFVNTEFNHKRILDALKKDDADEEHCPNISLVSIPDGLEATADRNEVGKLSGSIMATMPQKLEELITCKLNNDDPITALVFDVNLGFVPKVASKIGIKTVGFFASSAASFALFTSIPGLIHDGIIDHDGYVKKKCIFEISPSIPPFDTENLIWNRIGDPITQNTMFKMMVSCMEDSKDTEWILCNSTHELEPGAFLILPKFLQIGPLLPNYTNTSGSQFLQQDLTCLNWLDQQPSKSVIYVTFDSHTTLDLTQFQELEKGLELTSKTFLLVVRPGQFGDSNYEIKTNRGKVVGWAPQQAVLSHPSIACFVSHCGWNSTIEGLSNGVPFLCWPFVFDQFLNKAYICDVWKVGLGFNLTENGIVTKEEFNGKVEQLFENKNIVKNCSKIKTLLSESLGKGGRSSNNLNNFINWLKSSG